MWCQIPISSPTCATIETGLWVLRGIRVTIINAAAERLKHLLELGSELRVGNERGQAKDVNHAQRCVGFFAPALHAIEMATPSGDNAYRKQAAEIADQSRGRGYRVPTSVGEMTELLGHLLDDVEAGLLTSVANQVRGEVFDDFLEHAEEYANSNMKDQSGVIAGVVFEDTVRRIATNNNVEQRGQKLDAIISKLNKLNVLTAIQAKRARVCAGVRTKATHAQWEEVQMTDVEATIIFTRELIVGQIDT